MCVNAQNACGISASRCVLVKGAPNTPGIIVPNPSSWCAPASGIEFLSDVNALGGSYTLNWTWTPAYAANYVIGQGTNDLILDWVNAGNATVSLTAQNACGNATRALPVNVSSCRIAGNQSTKSNHPANVVQAFPNPASDRVYIEFASLLNGKEQLIVTDMTGRKILEQYISVAQGNNNTAINTRKLSSGIYYLHVLNQRIKLVLEK